MTVTPRPIQPSIIVQDAGFGTLKLTSKYPLGEINQTLADLFAGCARKFPDRTVIAEKNSEGSYATLSYQKAYEAARAVAAQLIKLEGGQNTPLMILSGASRAHFVVSWGAILAGVPYVPVSGNYATVPAAFGKLKAVFETTKPVFVWSEDYAVQREALVATGLAEKSFMWLGSHAPGSAMALELELEGNEVSDRLVDERVAEFSGHRGALYVYLGLNGQSQRRHSYPWHDHDDAGSARRPRRR